MAQELSKWRIESCLREEAAADVLFSMAADSKAPAGEAAGGPLASASWEL